MDLDNSTSKPLLSDEVFTGKWVDMLGRTFKSLELYCYSDKDGILEVEHSSDKSTVYTFKEIPCNAHLREHINTQPDRRYARIKYTNSSSDQTIFFLHTYHRESLHDDSLGYSGNLFNGLKVANSHSNIYNSLDHHNLTMALSSDVDCVLSLSVSQDRINWVSTGLKYTLDDSNDHKHFETINSCFQFFMFQTDSEATLNCSMVSKK